MSKRWTKKEVEKLKELYPHDLTTELVAMFGKSKNSLEHKASSLNIKKNRSMFDKFIGKQYKGY